MLVCIWSHRQFFICVTESQKVKTFELGPKMLGWSEDSKMSKMQLF